MATRKIFLLAILLLVACGLDNLGCTPKGPPPAYRQGFADGYRDFDNPLYENADQERLQRDPDYRRGYRDGFAAREKEVEEKKDGLWGWLSGKW